MTKFISNNCNKGLALTLHRLSAYAATLLRSAAFTAVAVGIVAASPAQADYSVQTNANTGGSYNRGCAATYNYFGPSSGAKFVVNDGTNASCPPPATSFNNQLITIGGSLDTTGRLTAANDMSTVQAINGSYGAVATAAADLATGQVHLAASAFGDLGGAIASARLNDTLHFTVAGADANTVTYIPVSFAFDGRLDGPSNPNTAYAELNYSFSFGGAYASEFGDYGAGYYGINGTYPNFAYAGAPQVGGWVSSAFASYNPLDTRFAGVYAIMGAAARRPHRLLSGNQRYTGFARFLAHGQRECRSCRRRNVHLGFRNFLERECRCSSRTGGVGNDDRRNWICGWCRPQAQTHDPSRFCVGRR